MNGPPRFPEEARYPCRLRMHHCVEHTQRGCPPPCAMTCSRRPQTSTISETDIGAFETSSLNFASRGLPTRVTCNTLDAVITHGCTNTSLAVTGLHCRIDCAESLESQGCHCGSKLLLPMLVSFPRVGSSKLFACLFPIVGQCRSAPAHRTSTWDPSLHSCRLLHCHPCSTAAPSPASLHSFLTWPVFQLKHFM